MQTHQTIIPAPFEYYQSRDLPIISSILVLFRRILSSSDSVDTHSQQPYPHVVLENLLEVALQIMLDPEGKYNLSPCIDRYTNHQNYPDKFLFLIGKLGYRITREGENTFIMRDSNLQKYKEKNILFVIDIMYQMSEDNQTRYDISKLISGESNDFITEISQIFCNLGYYLFLDHKGSSIVSLDNQ